MADLDDCDAEPQPEFDFVIEIVGGQKRFYD